MIRHITFVTFPSRQRSQPIKTARLCAQKRVSTDDWVQNMSHRLYAWSFILGQSNATFRLLWGRAAPPTYYCSLVHTPHNTMRHIAFKREELHVRLYYSVAWYISYDTDNTNHTVRHITFEREKLHIRLDRGVRRLPPDEPFYVEHRVHGI